MVMSKGNFLFLCVALGVLLVSNGIESLHLKGPGISGKTKSSNENHKRIYHFPTVKGPDSGVPSPPYLEKLTRLVSRENEVRNDVQKWRNLKVLDELERKFMERDDAGPNEVYNNKKGSDDEYNDVFGKTPNQGTEEEEEEKQEEEDEREDVTDQEDEKEEEVNENNKEMIDEGKEEKSDEKDNNKDGKDENTDKNREKKARLEDLLLRELENLKKD
mmetsp:Transcript_35486/g.56767  ORF Transcript_35486/g.56767 Transcript_35486/m.56767 type:complete len:217 (-) Transcript_35486:133-783(-)